MQPPKPPEKNEKPKKRKRGRPRADEGIGIGAIMSLVPAGVRRSKLNWLCLTCAVQALQQVPDHATRWRWLEPVNGKFPRSVVLYELGRVGNPASICWLADQLCTGKFTAVEVARRIRAWRLNREILPPAAAEELAAALVKTVNQYAATHQEVTYELVEDAVDRVLGMLQDDDDDIEDDDDIDEDDDQDDDDQDDS
jgi:hypothetical protein